MSRLARLGRVLRPPVASDHSHGTRGAAATAAQRTFCLKIGGSAFVETNGYQGTTATIAIVAVVPWYPFVSTKAEPPIFKQKVLCAAVAAAPLVPWLWSLATGGRRTRPSRASLLMGLLLA